jgi:hypothetical protein
MYFPGLSVPGQKGEFLRPGVMPCPAFLVFCNHLPENPTPVFAFRQQLRGLDGQYHVAGTGTTEMAVVPI